jgi:hypothetical protein
MKELQRRETVAPNSISVDFTNLGSDCRLTCKKRCDGIKRQP